MDLNELKEAIQSDNIEKADNILQEIGSKKNKKAVPFLIEQMRKTDNHLLRNAIALALRDIGSQEVVEPIIQMLNDSKTLGYRGSLLYALEPFDYSEHIEMLVDFLIQGNYEVRHKARNLIEAINKDIPDGVLLNCIIRVKREVDELAEKHDFLSESLDGLFKLKNE